MTAPPDSTPVVITANGSLLQTGKPSPGRRGRNVVPPENMIEPFPPAIVAPDIKQQPSHNDGAIRQFWETRQHDPSLVAQPAVVLAYLFGATSESCKVKDIKRTSVSVCMAIGWTPLS